MSEGNNYKSPWGKSPTPIKGKKTEKVIFQSPNNFKPSDLFGGDNLKMFYAIGAILFGLWVISGFYIVDQGEQAAVTRFGKFVRVTTAGANYHIPYPIESVNKVRVDRVQRVEIGFRSNASHINLHAPTSSQVNKFLPEEGLMLTGDENIADVNFFVQWRVANIKDYLYNVYNVKATIKSAAESAMREVIGYTTIAEALTHGKAKIQEDAKILLQRTLDEYGSGVMIENLSLLKVEAPSEVIDAFRDVQTARADKNNTINKAESYRNDVIPRARGEAEKMIQSSEGYKAKVTEEAKGDADKFRNIYLQYSKAKDVTKKRMYLEAMEKILAGAEKVILSDKMNKSAVPYLPLKQLNSKSGNAE
ncbi:MAG: FtsH protease activity modulator HflK [Alphaproteobacteria bacterium]|nr:FtsH protease activity modulator HflK [Alphaproteobacteria bacterium]